jgi:hypothetical protein
LDRELVQAIKQAMDSDKPYKARYDQSITQPDKLMIHAKIHEMLAEGYVFKEPAAGGAGGDDEAGGPAAKKPKVIPSYEEVSGLTLLWTNKHCTGELGGQGGRRYD